MNALAITRGTSVFALLVGLFSGLSGCELPSAPESGDPGQQQSDDVISYDSAEGAFFQEVLDAYDAQSCSGKVSGGWWPAVMDNGQCSVWLPPFWVMLNTSAGFAAASGQDLTWYYATMPLPKRPEAADAYLDSLVEDLQGQFGFSEVRVLSLRGFENGASGGAAAEVIGFFWKEQAFIGRLTLAAGTSCGSACVARVTIEWMPAGNAAQGKCLFSAMDASVTCPAQGCQTKSCGEFCKAQTFSSGTCWWASCLCNQ